MYYSIVSQDIDEEEWSSELLSEAIDLWVTIRGFSLASHWLEVYKQASKEEHWYQEDTELIRSVL